MLRKLPLVHRSRLLILAVAALAAVPPGRVQASPFDMKHGWVSANEAPTLGKIALELDQLKSWGLQLRKLDSLTKGHTLTPRQQLIVAWMRGQILFGLERPDEALAGMKAAAAAAPNEALAHVLLANTAFDFGNQVLAAEEIIAAAKLDMSVVGHMDEYDSTVIFSQLYIENKPDLRLELGRRLLDAGWKGGGSGLRSDLASRIVVQLIAANDVAGAGRYVMEITRPTAIAAALSRKDFAPFHQTLIDWAGPRLEKSWSAYLAESRSRFLQRPDAANVSDYASALQSAAYFETLVRDVLPVAIAIWERTKDEEWAIPIVQSATALARLGRTGEAIALLDRAERSIGKDSDNRINFTSNRAIFKLHGSRIAETHAELTEVIAAARGNPAVGRGVLSRLLTYRACASHLLGQPAALSEAQQVARDFGDVSSSNLAWMWACYDRMDLARDAFLSTLSDEWDRGELLSFLANDDAKGDFKSPLARDIRGRMDKLRKDPLLRAFAERMGVIRTWNIQEGVPPEANHSR